MGRKLDVLLGRTSKQTARLKSYLGLAVKRLVVLRGHRQVRCSQGRGDVEQLLRLGHPDRALLRAEQVIREQNMLDVFVMVEGYCNLLTERAALIDAHKECPEELREAAAGLVYAAARCGELPELQEVRLILTAKFGREFVSAAAELRSSCGINPKIVQKLSTKQPSLESRQMVLREIAAEKGISLQVQEEAYDTPKCYQDLDQSRKQDKEGGLSMPEVGLEKGVSTESAHKYKDVEAAAQAAFESAAIAAAAAKAAMELSRGESRGPDNGRKAGMVRIDETKEMTNAGEAFVDDGKKSEKISNVQKYSSEIEVSPENEPSQGSIAESNLKAKEQRNSAWSRPTSVRTRRGT